MKIPLFMLKSRSEKGWRFGSRRTACIRAATPVHERRSNPRRPT
jgi:hypothetical protein